MLDCCMPYCLLQINSARCKYEVSMTETNEYHGSHAHAIFFAFRGTEPYQCPEMFMGKPTDARKADVWAMGCLLYELVAGKVLFPGQGDCLKPIMVSDHLPAAWHVDGFGCSGFFNAIIHAAAMPSCELGLMHNRVCSCGACVTSQHLVIPEQDSTATDNVSLLYRLLGVAVG